MLDVHRHARVQIASKSLTTTEKKNDIYIESFTKIMWRNYRLAPPRFSQMQIIIIALLHASWVIVEFVNRFGTFKKGVFELLYAIIFVGFIV